MHSKSLKLLVSISTLVLIFVPLSGEAGSTSYTYDVLGRVITATFPNGTTVTYTYDSAGNRTSVSTGGGGGGGNLPPVCNNYTVTLPISPSPQYVYTTQGHFISQCTDPNGDTLSLVSSNPTIPRTSAIYSGMSVVFNYTISDGHGGTASATWTWYKPPG